MATCPISYSFALDCKTNKSGIKNVYFAVFADGAYSPTVASGIITAWTGAASKFYKYACRQGVATGGSKATSAKGSGAISFAPTLTLKLEKVYAAAQVELPILMQNRLLCIVELRSGKYFLMGYNSGVDVEYETTFGTAIGDFSGYTLTVTGEEETEMYEITAGIVSALVVT